MNHFQRAEHILTSVGVGPTLLTKDDSLDLLSGIDGICRSLHVVVRDDLTPASWNEFASHDQQALTASYGELGDKAQALHDSTGFDREDFEFRELGGDILKMAQQSATAQFIATCLASRFFEFRPRIEPPAVSDLAVASLESVVAWKPMQEYFGAERTRFYNEKFSLGLASFERVLWHYL